MSLVYLCPEREAAIKQNISWEGIDVGIRMLVLRFNQAVGIATTQSCAGHVQLLGSDAQSLPAPTTLNTKKDTYEFRIEGAYIAMFVNETRFFQLLTLAPQCGIRDISIRYFDDGTFWICLEWEPGKNDPAFEITWILLGEKGSGCA